MQTYKINPKMGGGLNKQVFAEDGNHISALILRLYGRRKDILGPAEVAWHFIRKYLRFIKRFADGYDAS